MVIVLEKQFMIRDLWQSKCWAISKWLWPDSWFTHIHTNGLFGGGGRKQLNPTYRSGTKKIFIKNLKQEQGSIEQTHIVEMREIKNMFSKEFSRIQKDLDYVSKDKASALEKTKMTSSFFYIW